MVTRFLLIRHGVCDPVGSSISGRRPGVHLNEKGKAQAAGLVLRLADEPIRAIYTSPLERTMETAEPLAHAKDLPIHPRESLSEVEFGEWTGKSFAELEPEPRWKWFNTFRSSTPPPGGELSVEVLTRSLRELLRLHAEHPDQTVAIFSHGDVIRALVMHFLGIPPDLLLRLEISPASLSRIELHDWGPKVLSVNETR